MQELANTLITKGTQCWACPLFDRLFEIISNTAATMYAHLTIIGVIVFCVLFAFYLINALWKYSQSDMSDSFLQKSLKPVLIKSLFVFALLSLGLTVPRFISKITFEPTALVTLEYSKAMLPQDYQIPDDYPAIQLDNNGFFNPALRNTIIQLLETSVTNFQVFIKVGIAIIDSAFTIPATFSFTFLLKRLLVFLIGLFLTYYFVQWFIKYSFCFMDIIVAMAMFAFFFPLSLVFFIFQGASDLPDWLKNLGKNLGGSQIKTLLNAIASVASTILTYTVIILVIRGYLVGNGINIDSIQNSAESIFDFDLDNPSAIQISFFGTIALVFIVQYLANKKDDITKEIMSAFNTKQENTLSKEAGENAWKLTTLVTNKSKQVVKTIVNPGAAKEEDKKEEKK